MLVVIIVCACSVVQSSLTVCDPINRSPPVSSAHGILQAGTLEWVAIPFSRGFSQPRDGNPVSYVSCTGRWALYR